MNDWENEITELAQKLNDKLKIDHINWHKFKGNKYRRSAELISAGLCQLIISKNEKDAIDYMEESIKWLKEINVDTKCPQKGSSFKS